MKVVILCNQLATRYLAGHPRKWFHNGDSGLFCAAGRLCTQWCHSQINLGAEILIADSTHKLHPCLHGQFVHGPTGNYCSGWGKRLSGIHRMGHPSTYLINSSSAKITLWWAFTWDTNIFTLFIHSESSIYTSSPNFFVICYSNTCLPISWQYSQTISDSSCISI